MRTKEFETDEIADAAMQVFGVAVMLQLQFKT